MYQNLKRACRAIVFPHFKNLLFVAFSLPSSLVKFPITQGLSRLNVFPRLPGTGCMFQLRALIG